MDGFIHALSHKVDACICQISAKLGQQVCQNREHKKKIDCINLQLAARISNNRSSQTCIARPPTFRPNLRAIGLLVVIVQPNTKDISTSDRRTDGQTSLTTAIGFSFKKVLKMIIYCQQKSNDNRFACIVLMICTHYPDARA